MFCPQCGAAGQAAKFCSGCGAALGAASPPPRVQNTVDVTVNVGAPVLVASGRGDRVSVPMVHSADAANDWYRNPVVIIMALVFFFPVGLPLMWKCASWSDETKWAVSGAFFWPIWSRFIWRQPWAQGLRLGLIAVLALAYVVVFTPLSGIALLLVGLPAFIWALRSARETRGQPHVLQMRAAVESDLSACHDLIAEIEATVALRLLPSTSPIHGKYLQALEWRGEACNILERANGESELSLAARKLALALQGLRDTRDGLLLGVV